MKYLLLHEGQDEHWTSREAEIGDHRILRPDQAETKQYVPSTRL